MSGLLFASVCQADISGISGKISIAEDEASDLLDSYIKVRYRLAKVRHRSIPKLQSSSGLYSWVRSLFGDGELVTKEAKENEIKLCYDLYKLRDDFKKLRKIVEKHATNLDPEVVRALYTNSVYSKYAPKFCGKSVSIDKCDKLKQQKDRATCVSLAGIKTSDDKALERLLNWIDHHLEELNANGFPRFVLVEDEWKMVFWSVPFAHVKSKRITDFLEKKIEIKYLQGKRAR